MITFALDRVDEYLASRDDCNKVASACVVDANRAFQGASGTADVIHLAGISLAAIENAEEFYHCKLKASSDFRFDGRVLDFSSQISDGSCNDTVYTHVWTSDVRKNMIIIIGHWNATEGAYFSLARAFHLYGMDAAVITLPHHGKRKSPFNKISDRFLSPSIGETIRSVRQSVLDVKDLITWLHNRGYQRISIVGASLGSCIASLVTCFERRISACCLLLTAGDFAEVVWRGRATRHIRESFYLNIGLLQLRQSWSIISPQSFVARLSRPGLKIHCISATRDKIVPPDTTINFINSLRSTGIHVTETRLCCGHYTMGLPPFNIVAVFRMMSFFD